MGYRLRLVEEVLGHRIDARRAELEIALRLQDLLDPDEEPTAAVDGHARAVGKATVE
jgi:hypothetical protein